MQFIRCETYQGAIAAAHVEFPTQELYEQSDANPRFCLPTQERHSRAEVNSGFRVVCPVVINQLGEATFLPPVSTIDEAIAAARAEIEINNHSYMDYVMQNMVTATNAIQHFQDCGIPLEMVPPLALDRPYFPTYSTIAIQPYLIHD